MSERVQRRAHIRRIPRQSSESGAFLGPAGLSDIEMVAWEQQRQTEKRYNLSRSQPRFHDLRQLRVSCISAMSLHQRFVNGLLFSFPV